MPAYRALLSIWWLLDKTHQTRPTSAGRVHVSACALGRASACVRARAPEWNAEMARGAGGPPARSDAQTRAHDWQTYTAKEEGKN